MLDLRSLVAAAILACLLVQTGCKPAVKTIPMAIDRARYDPAVATFPARVGVYFPADFYDNNFYHTTIDDYQLTFHNNPADATRQALDLAFRESFTEVRYLDTLQQGFAAGDLAFVIVPSIVAMPTHIDAQIIAVGVIYQFEFFVAGEHIHSWQVSGLDFAKQVVVQPVARPHGPPGQDELPRRVSAEKFDDVARGAVWDAVSVLLARLHRQSALTARLPAAVVDRQAAGAEVGVPVSLAMIGPVYDQGEEPEKGRFERCMLEGIENNGLSLHAVQQEELRDRLYPWLSRSNYPKSVGELEAVLARPAVRARLRELGVNYVLSWDGETVSAPATGPLYMTPYGIIGYESADKTSTLRADLLAAGDGRHVTSFESRREGTDTVLGLVLMPVPITSDTEGAVCAELTREIDAFLQAQRAAQRVAAGNPAGG